jgi:hypothetical protein
MVEDEPWDPSVASLVAFPQVIIMMGEKPDWVQDLGDAFLAQPEDVMDSVQRLRAQAQQAGNLTSNEQMVVKVEQAPPPEPQTVVVQSSAPPQQVIVIEPAQPEVIYVPQYNPTVVGGAWPYPAYPPYYIPPPPGYWFSNVVGGAIATGIARGVGVGISNAIWGGFDWHHHDVDINVNRYNNINVNRRPDVNSNRVNWRHNVEHRRDVPYRGGNATRQSLQRKYQSTNREQFRGRRSSAARRVGRQCNSIRARSSAATPGRRPGTAVAAVAGAAGDITDGAERYEYTQSPCVRHRGHAWPDTDPRDHAVRTGSVRAPILSLARSGGGSAGRRRGAK